MKFNRKIGLRLLLLSLIAGVWYFGFKNNDYRITFQAKLAPGTIYSNLLLWNNWEMMR